MPRPSLRFRHFGLVMGGALVLGSASPGPVSGAEQAAPPASLPNAAAEPPLPLSLPAALARAESESALIRRAAREREEVAAREVGAGLYFPTNPVLGVAAGARRDPSYDPTRGPTFALRAEQMLEIGGQRGARLEVVRRAVRAARLREDVAHAEVRARVRTAYIAALIGDELVARARRRAELADRLVAAADTRASAGAASDVERALARLERGRAGRAVLEAELGAASARGLLRAVMGVEPLREIRLTTPLGPPPRPTVALATLLARAQERRKELAALEASRSELDAELVRLGREAIPSPTLSLDVGRDLPGQGFVTAGLAVPIPVARRYQGEKALVRAAQARVDDDRLLMARQIDADVASAWRLVEARQAELGLLETEALPSADSSESLVTEGWRAGKFDIFRVIQVAREAAEVRTAHLEALGALWEASVALDRAVGGQP
jgi:cobalt-zinc-cadmium efflux system outer membrane protein